MTTPANDPAPLVTGAPGIFPTHDPKESVTPQEYERLRLDRPDLALPHLSEFAGQLWSRLVSEILPPLSPEQLIVAVMTDRLLNGAPTPPKRSNWSRPPAGRTATGHPIYHREILSYPLLEDLQSPSPG